MTVLSGDLAGFPVVEVLRLLAATGAGGALRVDGPDRGVVFCRGGAVTRVVSRAADGLERAVARSGLLPAPDAARLDAGGEELAEVLRSHGADPALEQFLRHRTEEALFEIARWREGTFVLDPDGTHALGETFAYPLDELLDRVADRERAWPTIEATVGSLDTAVEAVIGVAGDDESVTLTRAQFRVVAAVDGQRSVRELASSLGDGLFETARAVAGLVDAGLARFGAERPVPAATPAAVDGAVPAAGLAPSAPAGTVLATVVAGAGTAEPVPPRIAAVNGSANGHANGVVNGVVNGHANGSLGAAHEGTPANGIGRLLPSRAAAAGDQPADPAAPALAGLPTEFAVGGARPDRGMVLKLLSAVKELAVTEEAT